MSRRNQGKNPDEEDSIRKAKEGNKRVDKTDKKIDKLNKTDLSPDEKLRRLLEEGE
jgi:hypothetical protein